ncbi:MAG: hypothetical protein KC994_10985, partial [Candidatus Omnitrophica bacterium]|nr:hypothetical protein [Candidatus Omnitrophota bacterium]
MRSTIRFMSWIVLSIFLQGYSFAVATKEPVLPAPPKDGVEVDPPLSADLPEDYSSLPLFGSIEWETQRLPWVEEGPYAGISGVAMAVHDGKIYVVGGFIPGGDETEDAASRRTSRWTWVYDPNSGSWDRLADAPFRTEYTRGIVAEDSLYLIAGACQFKKQDPPYRVLGDCARLDLSTDPPTWKEFAPLNVPRTHTAIGHVGKYLIVAGGNQYDFAENGYSHNTIRDTNEVFDLSHPELGWQLKTPVPAPPRGWCGSVATQDAVYLFGGITWNESNEILGAGETLRYDPQTDNWKKLASSPLPISAWEGDLYADRYVLLAGGVVRPVLETDDSPTWSDLVWAYDIQEDRWTRVDGVLPPGAVFNDPGVVIIDDTIYVLGAEG